MADIQETREVQEQKQETEAFEDASESTQRPDSGDIGQASAGPGLIDDVTSLPTDTVQSVAPGTGTILTAPQDEKESNGRLQHNEPATQNDDTLQVISIDNPESLQPTTDDEQSRGRPEKPLDVAIDNTDEHSEDQALPPNILRESPTVTPHEATITSEPLQSLPPPEAGASTERVQSQPPKKKLFGWLSRTASNTEKLTKTPPPLPPRQNTASSTATIGGTSSNTFLKTEDDRDTTGYQLRPQQSNRDSLKSRFKLVRLREEAGIDSFDDNENYVPGPSGRTQSLDVSALLAGKEIELKSGRTHRSLSNPMLNEELAPGTAVGTSAGPSSDLQGPVDWDLWQEVVYEGPAAVARTSADELSQAIARGIPSAIRGVVWQVLAQSKNDDLEVMYKDLVARGRTTDRRASELKLLPVDLSRRDTNANSRRNSAIPFEASNKDQERVDSSASSIHSVSSANSGANGIVTSPPTSQDGNSIEGTGKQLPDPLIEERRKIKGQLAVEKLEKAIRRDLGARTSFSKFLMSANLQDGLFGICKAYALFDEEVGYAQGMNFIAMPLLFNMPEEEAFCLFVRLMNQYRLRDLFIHDMPGLHLHLYQFERLLEDFEPAVYCHLHRRGVTPQLYATQWFLTLFAYRFPLQLVLRIYDLILSEGLEAAILKFGMVLMQKNAEKLLGMKDMAVLTTFLKERLFDVYIDASPSATSVLESGFFGSAGGIDNQVYRADALVQDACAIKITPELLKTYASEWEEKAQDEKARQAMEDAIKANNASLTFQLRSLQERIEKSDAEHVEVASELVRAKVENQQLKDENEGLKMRVTELQVIVEGQPGEVEARLRQEMDRIMQRNIEVQNENRALEEATTEMEGELVRAKLQHAESSGELETMRRKWSNITAMMSSAT